MYHSKYKRNRIIKNYHLKGHSTLNIMYLMIVSFFSFLSYIVRSFPLMHTCIFENAFLSRNRIKKGTILNPLHRPLLLMLFLGL